MYKRQALRRLPSIINDLRRKSDSFRMDEIEKSLMKLHISPVQSPTTGLPPPNTDRNSPIVSQVQANQEQNTDKDVNAPPPEHFQFRPGNHELTTPNESNRSPKGMTTMNYNADLYGKMTHPVEKILTEIPYTDRCV